MESYVDAKTYKDKYKGNTIPEDVLERKLIEASHDIDSLTYNRIKKIDFNNLTDFQKNIVVESVCMHADFLFQYGEFLEMPIAGYSAGTTSVSVRDMSVDGQNGVITSKRVFTQLKQTGLTVRLFI